MKKDIFMNKVFGYPFVQSWRGIPINELSSDEYEQMCMDWSGSNSWVDHSYLYSGGDYVNYNNKSKIETMLCEYCEYLNLIDYSKLPAIAVLKCANCGGKLGGK